MAKRRPLTVCVDEHLPPEVKTTFQHFGFRAIEAARTKGYAGKDEADYLPMLYSQNEIFITGDQEFFDWAKAERPRHAGIVLVPQQLEHGGREYFCKVAAGYISGYTEQSRFAMRGILLYPGTDGLHMIDETGTDTLGMSWELPELG